MMFHTGWNLAPEFVVPAFQDAELQQAFTLYLIIGIAVSVLATVVAWPRLTSARAPTASSPATVPVTP